MPTTVNGIGTHYYGKRNLQKRPGPCPHCGSQVELLSYDTRLWVVLLLIPIIPLGRKRVLDACPTCRRHYVMAADKWDTARQLEVSGALERYRAQPTAEAAIAVHHQMLSFHQHTQAAEFRKTLLEQFGDNAKVRAYLGAALAHFGNFAEAEAHFAQALALRPDMPEARIGLAEAHLRAGKLDEARALLDFLGKPGAEQLYSLAPLEQLAYAYQKRGQHTPALELFACLQAALPAVNEHNGFRKAVRKSEKALGRRTTQLPKLKFSWKRWFARTPAAGRDPRRAWRQLAWVGIFLALIALGFILTNEYIRRHRVLHVVNGYAQPISVDIPGVAQIANLRFVQTVALPEGQYRAIIRGAVEQSIPFTVRANYFDRWFGEPVWVLNPGGAAVLVREAVSYGRDAAPSTVTFHYGKPFQLFQHVSHPFTSLPTSLRLKRGEQRTLVQLEQYRGEATGIAQFYLARNDLPGIMNFGEVWLHTHPEDEPLLRFYAYAAQHTHQLARLQSFLQTGLTQRPVHIAWHRLHQSLQDTPAQHAALVREYDTLLSQDPLNSALLYLRGRIEADRSAGRDYFQRAVQADPANAYAELGLAYDRMMEADWTGARAHVDRAHELRPADPVFAHYHRMTQLALGETATLEQEARAAFSAEHRNAAAAAQLIEALVAQHRGAEVSTVCAAYESAWQNVTAPESRDAVRAVRRHALYVQGDFAALEADTARDRSPASQAQRLAALVEQGRPEEAAKLVPAERNEERPQIALALAIAYRLAGDVPAAERWEADVGQSWTPGTVDLNRAAAWLASSTPPTLREAQETSLAPQLKAEWLTVLALRHPSVRNELAPLAQRLNVERGFPSHLLQRALAAPR